MLLVLVVCAECEHGAERLAFRERRLVVGSFVISDNTCEICQSGYQSKCVHGSFVAQTIGTQSEKARIPFADGTLVPTPGQPDPDLIPSLLAASDVLGTGWFAAVAAEATAPARRSRSSVMALSV